MNKDISADLNKLPGLAKNWSIVGIKFGVSSTLVLGLLVLAGASHQNEPTSEAYFIFGSLIFFGIVIGAWFGLRWKRWLLRDSGVVAVQWWLLRLALDGFVAGGLLGSLWVGSMTIWRGTGDGAIWEALVLGMVIVGSIGGLIGSVVVALTGFPYILRTLQNKPVWPILVGVFFLAPMVLVGLIYMLSVVGRIR